MPPLKRKWFKISLTLMAAFTILYFLYWRFVAYVPLGWKKYTNTSTHYHYSFSYPREWILSECGNGEVIVAKKIVEKCYRPLDAPKEYIDTVYFQVFIPDNHYVIGLQEINVPARLKDWKTMFFAFDEESAMINHFSLIKINEYSRMSGSSLPVAPMDTDKYIKYSESNRWNKYVEKTENRVLVSQLSWFTIGFYPHKGYEKEFQWVKNSISYDYN